MDKEKNYPRLILDGKIPDPLPEGSVLDEIDGVPALISCFRDKDRTVGRSSYSRTQIDERNALMAVLYGNGQESAGIGVAEELAKEAKKLGRKFTRVRY